MDRPTFLVLGAAKAGTTSLHYYLAQHPDIFMSDPKEPPFFQIEYERGLEYYWSTYFRAYTGQRHAGEAAHRNLRLPYVTRRIAASVPDARFFVICRNPVDRALSAYWHNVTRGAEHRSFEDAIDENLERLAKGPHFESESEARLFAEALAYPGEGGQLRYASYLDAGYYARHVERFAAALGRDRIKVLFFDDLTKSPQATLDTAFEFLDLEPTTLADVSPQNQPVTPGVARIFRRAGAARAVRYFPLEWRLRVKRALGSMFPSSKPTMSPETHRMLSEHFRAHNEDLSRLTGRDPLPWDEPRLAVGPSVGSVGDP